MVAAHGNTSCLLVDVITSSEKITVINETVKIKLKIAVRVREVKKHATGDDGMSSVLI